MVSVVSTCTRVQKSTVLQGEDTHHTISHFQRYGGQLIHKQQWERDKIDRIRQLDWSNILLNSTHRFLSKNFLETTALQIFNPPVEIK